LEPKHAFLTRDIENGRVRNFAVDEIAVIVVSDTSPITNLAAIGQLDFRHPQGSAETDGRSRAIV
ncbi:MAG: hypothetical protein ACO3NK_01860, partial [Prochlorotrichaceae cyanobacterium]